MHEMTAMTPARASEIITAYGADSRRWPNDERAAVLVLAAVDPALRAELAAARAFDTHLAEWAQAPVAARAFDPSTLPRANRWRWVGGVGAMAAAAAGVALLTIAPSNPIGSGAPRPAPTVAAAPASNADAFAYVFTPTHDEESLI